jgi:hypothetical protein
MKIWEDTPPIGPPSHSFPFIRLDQAHASLTAIIFGYPRNHLHPRPDCPTDSSTAQSDHRTIGDVLLSTWYKSHSEVRRVGMVRVNLSRDRQPVAVERVQKKQGLGFVLLKAWDKLCFGDTTTLFISAAYLFERQASKEIWGRWYPLCSRRWL